MKLVASVLGGIGIGVIASLFTLGGCGGDKSPPPASTGGSNATNGGTSGNPGGSTSTNTSAGGSNGAGGTTSTGTTNPYTWSFYQNAEGWQTGIYPSAGTMTAVESNVTGQTYCDGGCADILINFNGEASQAINFMKYWSTNVDLTGKTLTARIKVTDDSGVISDIELHAQNGSTNSYKWSASATVKSGTTPALASIISSATAVTISTTITADTDAGTVFDPSQVQGIGFNVNGVASATGTAHLYVDQVDVN
jgi:hypothetical protein